MALVNTKEMLKKATEGKYAVCAFNVDNFELARAAVLAAEEERAPVIIAVVEPAYRAMGLYYFANFVRSLAENTLVPVALHLDHGSSVQSARECLDAGFTSVMIDASDKPLKANIKITLEVLKLAEKYDASVEGEIGHIPGFETESEDLSHDVVYTDPVEALEYYKQTGIHSLAVSIGTVHYMRREPLRLDFNLLERIRQIVDVPIVLHGGAAVTDEDMRSVVQRGVAKYNIAFKVYKAFLMGMHTALDNLREEVAPGKLFVFPYDVIRSGLEAAKSEMRSKIRLLGSASV